VHQVIVLTMRVILVLFLCASIARGEDLLLRFKAEYPAAAKRLEDAYKHVRIKAHHVSEERGGKLVEDAEYMRSGDSIRRVLTQPHKVEVRGGNARTYFILSKPRDGEFSITSYEANTQFVKSSRLLYVPLVAPYCFYGNRVVDFIKLPEVTLKSASSTTLDDEDVIEVVLQTSTPKGPTVQRLWFLPESWALSGFQLGLSGAPSERLASRATYEPGQPPKLKSLDLWLNRGERKTQNEHYEITEIEFTDIPESEFRVTAFGLDEPATLREGRGYLWFLLIATIVLVVLGVVFRKVAR